MRKLILLVLGVLLLVSTSCFAGPNVMTGIDEGDIVGMGSIKVSSFQAYCIISTWTTPNERECGFLIWNDLNSPDYIYASTTAVMDTDVALWTSSNAAVFDKFISTATLKSGSTTWTNLKVRNLYQNVTVLSTFNQFGSTSMFRGSVTVEGIDDTGNRNVEVIFSTGANTTANGAVVWICISTITWRLTDCVVGNYLKANNDLNMKLGGGTIASDKLDTNVIWLHPANKINAWYTKRNPVFLRVREGGAKCTVHYIKMYPR